MLGDAKEIFMMFPGGLGIQSSHLKENETARVKFQSGKEGIQDFHRLSLLGAQVISSHMAQEPMIDLLS
jgi:prophage maintenance system killer protein